MPRFKEYSYEQTKLVPISFEAQIQPGSFEYVLNYIVDRQIDLSVFNTAYHNDETGAPAYDPAILLKIVLYAYSRGITSSREIEQSCRENVIFMSLSADTAPHFTTIAGFISSMHDQIVPVFRDVLSLCYAEGLIGRKMFAVDGCKLSSNCSKEWSGTRHDFERKKEKIEHAVEYLLKKHVSTDGSECCGPVIRGKERKAIDGLKHRLLKIQGWLDTHPDDKRGARGIARQSNIVDNESVKMPTSHGVVQGYTGSAMVDAKRQVVVHAEAFGEGQEKAILLPMVEATRDNFETLGMRKDVFVKTQLIADSGYHSEENMQAVLEQNIDAYIADNRFRKRDPLLRGAQRFRRSIERDKAKYFHKRFHAADFKRDRKQDLLICPAGKSLRSVDRNYRNTSGLIGTMYRADASACQSCIYKNKCRSGKGIGARTVTLFRRRAKDAPVSYTQRMIERFDTPRGRYLYSRRMGIVEPVFAHIRNAKGLMRFSLRGKRKVDTQWKLFAIVHNMFKIFRYGQSR